MTADSNRKAPILSLQTTQSADADASPRGWLIVAALFTKARELIGIEMNEYFANLSQRIVQQDCKLLMFQPPRKCNIRIVQDDVRNQTDTLERADIVIFFNPFEQHFERDTHRELLQFMRQHVCRSGVRLITVPSMAEIYGRAVCPPVRCGA